MPSAANVATTAQNDFCKRHSSLRAADAVIATLTATDSARTLEPCTEFSLIVFWSSRAPCEANWIIAMPTKDPTTAASAATPNCRERAVIAVADQKRTCHACAASQSSVTSSAKYAREVLIHIKGYKRSASYATFLFNFRRLIASTCSKRAHHERKT